MNETVQNINGLCTAFGVIIGLAATFKIIKIMIDGQADEVPLKESLKKVKRVLCAAVICICLSAVVGIIQTYFD